MLPRLSTQVIAGACRASRWAATASASAPYRSSRVRTTTSRGLWPSRATRIRTSGPGSHGSGTSIQPSVPKTHTALSALARTPQRSSATTPPGKRSTAAACSSTPVSPIRPTARTASGSAPASSRAIDVQ